MGADPRLEEIKPEPEVPAAPERSIHLCDRCGHAMIETSCKVVCVNCGNRFDCSDLNLYFD